ncbi:hypothetical protein ACTWJ8_31845 [Streptomyces sp. SDT5-1]
MPLARGSGIPIDWLPDWAAVLILVVIFGVLFGLCVPPTLVLLKARRRK